MYQYGQHNHVFKRTLCDNNTLYQLQGEGKPFILLHGLLSDGEDLFPLAQELHEKLVNLYGFWIFQVWDVLLLNKRKSSSYLFECSEKLLEKATNGAHLIGHSFGAFILLEALVQEYIDKKYSITLLQPPVAKKC